MVGSWRWRAVPDDPAAVTASCTVDPGPNRESPQKSSCAGQLSCEHGLMILIILMISRNFIWILVSVVHRCGHAVYAAAADRPAGGCLEPSTVQSASALTTLHQLIECLHVGTSDVAHLSFNVTCKDVLLLATYRCCCECLRCRTARTECTNCCLACGMD